METACQDVLDSPFDEMLAAHIRCACAVTNANYEEAFACQILVVQYPCNGSCPYNDSCSEFSCILLNNLKIFL
jgi:hypothetical protein